WGCFGYCPGPLPFPQPHYTCFGYCPRPQYTCYGYCPYYPPYYPPYTPYPPLVYQPTTTTPAAAAGDDLNAAAKPPAQKKRDPGAAVYAGKTLGEWISSLLSPDPRSRANAAAELAQIGPDAKAAIPALISALGDVDARVRVQASLALGGIGRAAVPALIDA